jgi:hypothetical protein
VTRRSIVRAVTGLAGGALLTALLVAVLLLGSLANPGYWVRRNWEERAEVRTVSVIDTVATKSLVSGDVQVFIPMGGIAYSGAKGISRVEIQIDDAPGRPPSCGSRSQTSPG